jgi:hypothetical protein
VKYILVDNFGNKVAKIVLNNRTGIEGAYQARDYFRKIKKLDGNKFDRLWDVMEESEYNKQFEASIRPSHRDARWYEEEKAITDEELGLF